MSMSANPDQASPAPRFPALMVVDDFMPEPERVRAEILAGQFGDQTGPDGATYTNINVAHRPDLLALVEQAAGFKIRESFSFTRKDLAGELPHCAVHADRNCGEFAGVLYLNPPKECQGGTAFWAHRFLGLDHLPCRAEIEAKTWNPDLFYESMTADWRVKELWTMTGFVGMKFNRFITYPTQMFHSRWPREGFGQAGAGARIVWVCFFNRA